MKRFSSLEEQEHNIKSEEASLSSKKKNIPFLPIIISIVALVTNHQFNWWFDFSPPKGYITTRPTGRCHKHFYWSAIKRYY